MKKCPACNRYLDGDDKYKEVHDDCREKYRERQEQELKEKDIIKIGGFR